MCLLTDFFSRFVVEVTRAADPGAGAFCLEPELKLKIRRSRSGAQFKI